MAPCYRFGTSGYRSAEETGFNEAVVQQITHAIADYLIEEMNRSGQARPVLIGGDTREKSLRFIPMIAEWLRAKGLDVYRAEGDLPTPVLAYAASHFGALGLGPTESAGAILMTASHNPWEYGGYNFLTPNGAVVPSAISKQFEQLQEAPRQLTLDRVRLGLSETASVYPFDAFTVYQRHLKETLGIDFPKIRDSGLRIFYDPLYATGRNYFPRLLQEEGVDVAVLHGESDRPAGYTGMPEPNASNLGELSALVQEDFKTHGGLCLGLANDGDADRFGVLDEHGCSIHPNDVLLLALYTLRRHRCQQGVVARSQATSHALDDLAEQEGLSVLQTPVGYKYIAELFLDHQAEGKAPVLLGGESSGGLSIHGHIPEKDGILANLLMAELVAREGRNLSEILAEIKSKLPRQWVFQEISIKTGRGRGILDYAQEMLQNGGVLAGFAIDTEQSRQAFRALMGAFGTQDGVKLYLEGGHWLLFRASGTEPLLRLYLETTGDTRSQAKTSALLLQKELFQLLGARFGIMPEAITMKN